MPTVEVYHQMTEKDTSTVNGFWKAAHIILFATIIVCGFSTAYSLGSVLHSFGDNCILFANVTLSVEDPGIPIMVVHDPNENSTLLLARRTISLRQTIWGSEHTCSFCQFTPIMSAVFGLIWMVFFMMCSKGGAGYPSDVMVKPWHLVYPASVFAILFTIVLVASQFELFKGMKEFCMQLGDARCGKSINSYAFASYRIRSDPSTNCIITQYLGKASILAWLAQIGLLLTRVFCIADFGFHVVSITEQDEEEGSLSLPNQEKTKTRDGEDEQETSFVTE